MRCTPPILRTLQATAAWAKPLAVLLAILVTCGCAALKTPPSFEPESINDVRFRDRALSKYDADVRVSAAVPTAEETKALFHTDLVQREIQPIWVKVENHSNQTYYLISSAVDPNYYSPLEAAYAAGGGFLDTYRSQLGDHLRAANFRNPILPHTAVSGFIFTFS